MFVGTQIGRDRVDASAGQSGRELAHITVTGMAVSESVYIDGLLGAGAEFRNLRIGPENILYWTLTHAPDSLYSPSAVAPDLLFSPTR